MSSEVKWPTPDWLNGDAKTEWQRVIASGFEPGDAIRAAILAAYCVNHARWMQAEKILDSEGSEIVIRDDKGNVKSVSVSPQVAISNRALDRMMRAAAQIGYTKAPSIAGGENTGVTIEELAKMAVQ